MKSYLFICVFVYAYTIVGAYETTTKISKNDVKSVNPAGADLQSVP